MFELPAQVIQQLPEETRRMEAQLRGAERRRHPRITFGGMAYLHVDGAVDQQIIADVSEGGLFLKVTHPIRMGARVRLVLALPFLTKQKVVSLSGTVVRSVNGPDGAQLGAGVQFDEETGSSDLATLRDFIALWMPDRQDAAAEGASPAAAK